MFGSCCRAAARPACPAALACRAAASEAQWFRHRSRQVVHPGQTGHMTGQQQLGQPAQPTQPVHSPWALLRQPPAPWPARSADVQHLQVIVGDVLERAERVASTPAVVVYPLGHRRQQCTRTARAWRGRWRWSQTSLGGRPWIGRPANLLYV